MITFKLRNGLEGYNMTKELRERYLNTGAKDLHDEEAIHIAGYENDKVICAGRMYTVSNIKCIIDNVIVDDDNRKQYVGDTILRALEDKAVQLARAIIGVIPTGDSKGFFEAEGYMGEGELIKDLTVIRGCRGCKK